MNEVRVETGVDDLLSLLREKKKISLRDAAHELGVKESFVQSWVDFLVEERVLGIEYRFTKPYIFLNNAKGLDEKPSENKQLQGLAALKQAYFAHAKEKGMPEEKVQTFWIKHLHDALEKRKEYFLREANKRRLPHPEQFYEAYVGALEQV